MRQRGSVVSITGHLRVKSSTGRVWASVLKENPDLPYSLIKEILFGLDELDQGEKTEYKFG